MTFAHLFYAISTFALIIPANVTDLKKKLAGAFNKKSSDTALDDGKKKELNRHTGTEVAKERAKRKALADELANEKTSAARKQEIIDGLNAQLEAAQTENEDYKTKLEDLSPKAKKWSDFEHAERTKLLAMFPAEEVKDAKKIAEGMDIDTFRKYTTRITGAGKTSTDQGAKGNGKTKDWESIMKGDKANEEIAADPDGFNKFMEGVK